MTRLERILPLGQALAGVLIMVLPAPVARAVSSTPSSVPAAWLLRLLGLRLLVQGGTGTLWPGRRVAALSAGVDATHGATMVLAAVMLPRFRRPAVISGLMSLASTVISALAARSAARPNR